MFWNLPHSPSSHHLPVSAALAALWGGSFSMAGGPETQVHSWSPGRRRELGTSEKALGSGKRLPMELRQEEWALGKTPGKYKACTLWISAGARRKELLGVSTPHFLLKDLSLGCYIPGTTSALKLWTPMSSSLEHSSCPLSPPLCTSTCICSSASNRPENSHHSHRGLCRHHPQCYHILSASNVDWFN